MMLRVYVVVRVEGMAQFFNLGLKALIYFDHQ